MTSPKANKPKRGKTLNEKLTVIFFQRYMNLISLDRQLNTLQDDMRCTTNRYEIDALQRKNQMTVKNTTKKHTTKKFETKAASIDVQLA
jgi:hypothetical protein